MSSPFGMSFEDVKAQAAANMRADKGQIAPAAAQETNPAAASGQTVAESGKKSFNEMVEKAQRDIAKGVKTEETAAADTSAPIMPAPETQPETPVKIEASANLSFDEMFKNAETSKQKEISFDTLFAQNANQEAPAAASAETAETTTASFDHMSQQTDNQETPAAATVSFDTMLQQTGTSNEVATSAETTTASFDEMLKQTETSNGQTAESKAAESTEISFDNVFPQTAVSEKPAAEPETGTETAVPSSEEMFQQTGESTPSESDAPVKEETAQDNGPAADTEVSGTAEENPATEEETAEPVAETAKLEQKQKRARRSGGRKKEVAAEAEKEPLPDTTEDYKVDILGEKKEPPVSQEEDQPLSVESLFTAEEIAAFRADIRAFVRKEFKTAMVGAVKDLLKEFSE